VVTPAAIQAIRPLATASPVYHVSITD
jgi:hypothetical protein